MTQSLNVLLLEDREDDAHLIVHEMRRAGYEPRWRRVEKEEAFRRALSNELDLILADYNLPQFTGLEALRILQQRNLDVPFIVITGTLEEAALACMKEGATDYLLKDRLSRLGEAVRRALEERRLRQERAQAQADLRESEARFRRLAENAPDIIFRFKIDHRPTLDFINQAVTDVTGYSPPDFYHDPELFKKVLHPDDTYIWDDFFILEKVRFHVECRFTHRDGSVHWIQIRTTPIYDTEDRLVAIEGIGREVTEIKEAEHAEQKQRQLAEALRDTATILNSTLALEAVFDGILENVDRVVPHDGANVMLIEDGKARVAACHGYYQQKKIVDLVMALRLPVAETANLRMMVETKRPFIIPHTQQDSVWLSSPATTWVQSHISAPIQREGNVIGFLNLDSETPGFYNESYADRLQAFADQVAIAIRNAQLYEAEQRQRRIEETLRQAAAVLNETLRLDVVFSRIFEQLGQVVDFDSGSLQQKEDEWLVTKAATGFPNTGQIIGMAVPIAADYPDAQILESHRALAITDATAAYKGFKKMAAKYGLPTIRSWLGVPMIVQDEVIGMITLDRHEVRPFTDEEIELATAFANHAAIALQNARLYKELEYYNEQLEQAVLARTRELRQAMQRAETILQNSPDAILLLSDERKIQTSNPAFCALFGYETDKVIGWSPIRLVASDYQPALRNLLDRSLQQRQTERAELVAQHQNGTQFDVEVALSPIVNQGGVGGLVCTMRDISALKEVERMKDAFIANVSHELRTPITNLQLHSDLLKRNPRKRETYTDRIGREVIRLGLIVEDLLRLSRLEQGQVTLQREAFQLNDLIRQYAEDRQILVQQKNLTLQIELAPDLTAVHADRSLIGQVLSILLTNAINYTPSGGTITIATQQKNSVWQGFCVSDTGPGILPEEQDKLFVRFYRGRAGQNSGEPGTGLGLSIAKEIIDRHNGRIHVHSDGIPGKGTTFSVWLPL